MRATLIAVLLVISQLGAARAKYWMFDTSQVMYFQQMIFLNCREKILDTICFVNADTVPDFEYEMYYDKPMQQLNCIRRISHDTVYFFRYYRSGALKEEKITVGPNQITFRRTKWCENGNLIWRDNSVPFELYRDVSYHCNGVKAFEANTYKYYWFDTVTWYYDNGQKSMQKYYTHFDETYADFGEGSDPSSEISHPRYWKPNGDTLPWQWKDNGINDPEQPPRKRSIGLPGPADVVSHNDVDSGGWYSRDMERFKDSMYSHLDYPDSCYCTNGYLLIAFQVEEDSMIYNIRIQHDVDPAIANAIRDAILRVRTWPVGMHYERPVRTSVLFGLKLEDIPH